VQASILDEAQKLPELFERLKFAYDAGQISFSVLLGSSQILLNRRIGESLAGRVLIYELWPLTLSELTAVDGSELRVPLFETLLTTPNVDDVLKDRPSLADPQTGDGARAAEDYLLRWGGMPKLWHMRESLRRTWLKSYEEAYLERDLGDLARLHDLEAFRKFQRLTALRSGHLLSYSELGRDAGVSVESARRYLEYLRLSYQAILLPPYARNLTSRLVKTPKVYWVDCGLWQSMTGRFELVTGELFESYVVAEGIKYARSRQIPAEFTFYRTRSGMEVDLLVELDGKVLGIECKASDHVDRRDASGLSAVGAMLGSEWRGGLVVYRGREIASLGERIWAVPSSRLFGAP